MDLSSLGLTSEIIQSLTRAKLTDKTSIMNLSIPELTRLTQLSNLEASLVRRKVSDSIWDQPNITVKDIKEKAAHVPERLFIRKLSVGCPIIDQFLKGGVSSSGITEVAGQSASGKTQICLQLSLCVQLPERLGGMSAGCVYICTEDVFPSRRLHQMIQSIKVRYTHNQDVTNINFSDHIYVEHASDKESLFHSVFHKLPHLLSRDLVKLIIVDSTAALFRCEYSSHEMIQRARDMQALAARLQKYGAEYNIPIVCVNQVTDVVDKESCNPSIDHHKRKFIPSLGLTWSNLVTTRILTSRTQQTIQIGTGLTTSAVVRTMELVFAPNLRPSTCYYVVDHAGVRGLSL